jgi:hypothetical protein
VEQREGCEVVELQLNMDHKVVAFHYLNVSLFNSAQPHFRLSTHALPPVPPGLKVHHPRTAGPQPRPKTQLARTNFRPEVLLVHRRRRSTFLRHGRKTVIIIFNK